MTQYRDTKQKVHSYQITVWKNVFYITSFNIQKDSMHKKYTQNYRPLHLKIFSISVPLYFIFFLFISVVIMLLIPFLEDFSGMCCSWDVLLSMKKKLQMFLQWKNGMCSLSWHKVILKMSKQISFLKVPSPLLPSHFLKISI